jgi:acylphosphatase
VVRRRVIVHGRVQGVFFRDTVRRAAEAKNVAGSAENRSNGTVEVVFEGSADDVEALIDVCRHGSPQAVVERIEVAEETPGDITGFRVL